MPGGAPGADSITRPRYADSPPTEL